MKSEFKAKFLQHVAKRKKEEGFTLIELLVVIIIIGILSAIALPSFLNQANKAKQSEAKQYLSAINKGAQAYYAENSDFKTIDDAQYIDVVNLDIGIRTETTNYQYKLEDYDPTNGILVAKAAPTSNALRGYAAAVGLVQGQGSGAKTSTTILCEQIVAGEDFAATYGEIEAPKIVNNELECGASQTEVTK